MLLDVEVFMSKPYIIELGYVTAVAGVQMSRNYHLRDLNIPVGRHLYLPKLFLRSEPAPPDSLYIMSIYIIHVI